jgi:hypothetical protein
MMPKITEFKSLEKPKYGISQKTWNGEILFGDDDIVPVELMITEYREDEAKSQSTCFSVDFSQTKKYFGDEFETLEQALADAYLRMEDLYLDGILEKADKSPDYSYNDGEF